MRPRASIRPPVDVRTPTASNARGSGISVLVDGETLDLWGVWQSAEGRAPGTVYLQRRYLERLAARHDLDTVTGDEIAGWLAGRGWSNSTRKSARSAVRAFFGWAHRHQLRDDNPTELLGPVRLPPPCPRPTADLVFIRACQQATGPELLMLLLAATCGLRRAEIAGLHTDMVSGGKLWVTGKGGKPRAVPIVNADLARMLADVPEGWLFPGRFGGPVTPDYVGRRLSKLLGPGWSGHSLRHRYASATFAGSRNLLAVQKLLGHASPETTQRYVEVDDAAIWEAARYAA